jgi:hypothetical protein
MSSIAAVLLMYLNEEDAFWAMVVLIGSPKFAMHGMLIPGLPKLIAYCDFHAAMRKRIIPKMDRHFVSSCVTSHLLLSPLNSLRIAIPLYDVSCDFLCLC